MNANADYCRALVRTADRDRYLATLYAPATDRPALHALYAFDVEIGRIRELAREPLPGEIRLQWWREVLQGQRNDEAAANPVSAALRSMLDRYRLSPEPLLQLLDARQFDLYHEPMATVADLERYARQTSAIIFEMAATLVTNREFAGDPLLHHAAMAATYAGLLRSFALHSARGQLYVPADLLSQFSADPAQAWSGRVTPPWRAVLDELVRRARAHLCSARQHEGGMMRDTCPVLLPLVLIGPRLARISRPGVDPFTLDDIPAWRRQWLIWRAARNPSRIFV
jgi:phytoene synthase